MLESATTEKPAVLIYTEPLLGRSMTFVRTQTEALTSFTPYYIGPHYLRDGLSLPPERVIVMRRGENVFSHLAVIPFKVMGVAPLFIRRLKKLRPVLLHAHFGPMGLRALPLARALRIPLVVTFQGYDATMYDRFLKASDQHSVRLYVRRRKILNERTNLFIAVSRFVRDEMIRQGFSADKIVVHYVGVDTELFCPEPHVEREPIVLFAGRLVEKKGCKYLIQAMCKVQSKSPEIELVVIGDGELRSGLEQMAAQSLTKYRFLGFQSPEVVRHWLNRARLFAAPSIRASSGDAEGYPNAFAEAQSMGVPVASFDSDGVREAVVHGKTGFLAPEGNVEALAGYLERFCTDANLCARMGEAARAHVCAHFNVRIQTRSLEDLYLGVLGNPPSKASTQQSAEATDEPVATVDSQG